MDGATDGAIRLEALREFAADFKAPIFTQFDDSVVAVSAPDFLEPHGLDMHKLITGFLSRYGDVADFLVAVTDLPANSPLYSYAGLYVDVRNTVRGTGKGIFDRDRPVFGEKLKGWIHLSYFSPSFFPEALRHEIPTRWRPRSSRAVHGLNERCREHDAGGLLPRAPRLEELLPDGPWKALRPRVVTLLVQPQEAARGEAGQDEEREGARMIPVDASMLLTRYRNG